MFDTIVIGGGPCGLTLATYLPGKVCLIERGKTLGGCHRVYRNNEGLFSEHGPRVYSGAYVNVKRVLKDIGTSWDTSFKKVHFTPELINGKHWYQHLSFRESLLLSYEYVKMMLNFGNVQQTQRNTSMKDWCLKHRFSAYSMDYIDRVCRYSDGAGIDRYSVYEFLRGFDQHNYPFYEPRIANDKGLFVLWENYLRKKGNVTIMKDASISKILSRSGVELENGTIIAGRRIVCAIPPQNLVALLKSSKYTVPESLTEFAEETEYDDYYSIAYHFQKHSLPDLPKGFFTTPWGLVWMRMHTLDHKEPYDILSVAITRTDKLKTFKGDIVKEVWRQLQTVLRLPVHPIRVNMPKTHHHDEAFVAAAGKGFIDSTIVPGYLYSVGTHNGHSSYDFTSMESAVQNALAFMGMSRDVSYTVQDTVFLAFPLLLLTLITYLKYRKL